MFCTNCGSKLPEGARFCSICGVRVAETEPEEKVVTPLDLDFSDVKPAEAPMKTRVTFDWSNVIDEPHRRNTETIKSPWETSSTVEEKDILAEMTPSTERSRTMSFIDVLKAEKELQAETKAEDKPVEEPISTLEEMITEDSEASQGFDYTEVLDPGYLNDIVEEPVKSPFDEAESTEPEFEEPDFEGNVEETAEETHDDWFEMPAFLQPREDRVAFEEAPIIESHEVEIPSVEKNVEDFTPEEEALEETAAVDDSAITEAGFVEEVQKILDETENTLEDEAEVEAPTLDIEDVAEAEDITEEIDDTVEAVEEVPENIEVPVLDIADVAEEVVDDIPTDDDAVDALVDEYDDYMNIETEERVGRGHRSEQYEDEFEDEDDDELDDDTEDAYIEEVVEETSEIYTEEPETYDEVSEYEEEDFDDSEDEETESVEEIEAEIFDNAELPKHSGMTIAAPADRESEIEALKARLAELMGTTVDAEPEVVAEEPEEESVEELVEEYLEEPVIEDVSIAEDVPEAQADSVEIEVEAPSFDEDAITDYGFEDELAAYLNMDDPTVEKSEDDATSDSVEKEAINTDADDFEMIDALLAEAEDNLVEEEEAPAEIMEEAVEAIEEGDAEEVAESEEPTIDDILAAVLQEATVPASETVAVAPVVDIVPEAEIASEEVVAETTEDATPEAESEEDADDTEETVEDVVTEESKTVEEISDSEEETPAKETDAVSLEDLEKDLFGISDDDDAEAEVTKKIDKFYTLYRKNEEFQRLLDEEYTKLKAAGGTAPEPVLPVEEPERPVEDATIYQPLDRPLDEIAKEEAAKAAAKAEGEKTEAKPVIKADPEADKVEIKDAAIPVAAVAGAAAAAVTTEAKGQGPEVEYEEVDKGGTFLTILAVVIALLLVVLLAVLLILNLAPSSGAAIWIDSIIENISSHFTAVDGSITEYLL